jgi:hypothetical protein
MGHEIERFAPARQRKRTAWIREALRAAVMAEYQRELEESYRKHPPEPVEEYFDPEVWEKVPPGTWDAPEPRKAKRPAKRRRR